MESNTNAAVAIPVRCVYGSSAPTVATNATTPTVTFTSANSLGGNVYSNGGSSITARGICYAPSTTTTTPTTSNYKVTYSAGTGNFTVNLTNLTPGVTYYYRAYATNAQGTSYGEVKSFTTSAASYVYNDNSSNNGDVTMITKTSAKLWGKANAVSGDPISGWGFILYKQNSSGTFVQVMDAYQSGSVSTPYSWTEDGYSVTLNSTSQNNYFSMTVNGLEPGATYKYMAQIYCENSNSWWYPGKTANSDDGVKSDPFTTYKAPSVSTITSEKDYSGDRMRITLKGKVTEAGYPSSETKQGILFSTSSSNLDIAHYAIGSHRYELSRNSDGSFSTTRVPFSAGTTWYYRAYAYNTTSKDTVYGSTFSFVTPERPSDVAYDNAYANAYYYSAEVTNNSIRAKVSANAPTDAPVYRYGIVYSTSNSTPTVGGSNCSVQWNTSSTFYVTGLSANTKYYMRAVAYNAASYSAENTWTYTYAPTSNIRVIKTKLNCGSNLTDQNGNVYQTGTVGSHCWMLQNLKAKNYDNTLNYSTAGTGTLIPLISGTNGSDSYARYNPGNDASTVGSSSYSDGVGYLYNWYGAMGQGVNNYGGVSNMSTSQGKNQGACPRGWHVPTHAEQVDAASAFPAQYAGYLDYNVTYGGLGNEGDYWSSDSFTNNGATYYYYLKKTSSSTTTSSGRLPKYGHSLRCVQD